MSALSFAAKHKTTLFIAGAAVLVFGWYEVRPAMVFKACNVQATADAQVLLSSKATASKGTKEGDTLQALADQHLYLRPDYESFLVKCLASHGLQLEPLKTPAK